jgi:hypothetical protein
MEHAGEDQILAIYLSGESIYLPVMIWLRYG